MIMMLTCKFLLTHHRYLSCPEQDDHDSSSDSTAEMTCPFKKTTIKVNKFMGEERNVTRKSYSNEYEEILNMKDSHNFSLKRIDDIEDDKEKENEKEIDREKGKEMAKEEAKEKVLELSKKLSMVSEHGHNDLDDYFGLKSRSHTLIENGFDKKARTCSILRRLEIKLDEKHRMSSII